jgi:hypothetical protein
MQFYLYNFLYFRYCSGLNAGTKGVLKHLTLAALIA